jgi:hypothetical protein
MIELKSWIEQNKFTDKPWLILGKGPTFARIKEVNLGDYSTLALNHVVREQKVDVAHIVDIDVIEALGQSLVENCTWLIMPRTPHVKCFASEYLRLEDWINCIPTLREVEKQGKLVTYSFSHEPVSDDPWAIICRYFSSEAALGILARLGAKEVRSLGVDGGRNYSKTFQDLQDTLLVNSQPSFDLQFDELGKIAHQFHIDYAPLFQVSSASACNAPLQQAVSIDVQNKLLHETVSADAQNEPLRSQDKDDPSDSLGDSAKTNARPTLSSNLTTAARVQQLEYDYRSLREQLRATSEELAKTAKELGISSDRLGWARDEISEYRARVIQLESELHTAYASPSWKIGRLFTKPAQVLSKRLADQAGKP